MQDNSTNITIMFALIILSMGLVKLLDIVLKKILPNKQILSDEELEVIKKSNEMLIGITQKVSEESLLTPQEQEWLKNLHTLHDKTDKDGIPLWYVPRSFIDTQKEVIQILSNISKHQEKTTYVLESILKKLEK